MSLATSLANEWVQGYLGELEKKVNLNRERVFMCSPTAWLAKTLRRLDLGSRNRNSPKDRNQVFNIHAMAFSRIIHSLMFVLKLVTQIIANLFSLQHIFILKVLIRNLSLKIIFIVIIQYN